MFVPPLRKGAAGFLQMKIKLKQSVVVRGHPGVKAGDEIEAAPQLSSELLGLGLAEIAAETIQTREPVIENRDPGTQPVQPSKPRRSKSVVP